MKTYKSEASINKILAELQIANTAISSEEAKEEDLTLTEMLREALKSENEAIEIYSKLAQRSECMGIKILTKAFIELKEDEEKHIGNLNYLLKLLCDDAVRNEQEGEAEEAQLLANNNN